MHIIIYLEQVYFIQEEKNRPSNFANMCCLYVSSDSAEFANILLVAQEYNILFSIHQVLVLVKLNLKDYTFGPISQYLEMLYFNILQCILFIPIYLPFGEYIFLVTQNLVYMFSYIRFAVMYIIVLRFI